MAILMKLNKIRKLVMMLTAMVPVLFSFGVSPTNASSPIILGYYTSDSTNALHSFHNYMNQLSTDSFTTDAKGNISGSVPTDATSYANAVEIVPYAAVSNYGESDWDSDIAHQLLTNPKAKNKLISQMVSLVEKNKYKGINIDFEAVLPSDRTAMSNFVREVTKKMKAKGYLTMVSVPAKSVDDLTDSWTGAYDYAKLGKYADIIQVMTYDEHGVWSDPGSVASKPWITASLQFAINNIPSEKILMGIPEYGNDWNLSDLTNNGNQLIEWKDIPKLISQTKAKPVRDRVSGSMHFTYTSTDGSKHVVWYEDATSIKQKTHYSVTYGLAGVSIYALGYEDYTFWEAVSAGLQ